MEFARLGNFALRNMVLLILLAAVLADTKPTANLDDTDDVAESVTPAAT